ncbi:MAG: cadherin-like beta sandwich domain-containing protein [Syntrophomonadaceae bacterium]
MVYFSGTPPTLGSDITVDGTATNDLLTALNANLDVLQDDTLYQWQAGSGGYPTFDFIKWADSTPAASSDASLLSLTISSGTLSPAFAPETTSYTASVAHGVSSVNVTPTVNQADASLTVNSSAATSGTPSAVGLNVGVNTITILVTAQDNSTTETYTITITRAAATDGFITPTTAGFDKYSASDVTITKSDGDHTLIGIKNDAVTLALGEDYTIDGVTDTVTIKKGIPGRPGYWHRGFDL